MQGRQLLGVHIIASTPHHHTHLSLRTSSATKGMSSSDSMEAMIWPPRP
jgi:hypothetical protein